MNQWAVIRDRRNLSWTLLKNGEVYGKYPPGNGSRNSGKLQCLRALADELGKERFSDQPEKSFEVAKAVVKLAKKSGLCVEVKHPGN